MPNEVKKNLLNPRDLNDNERYAGTDWRVAGDNCITYTFSGIMGGVRSIVNDVENSSFGSRMQAMALIRLSFRVSFGGEVRLVTAALDQFVADNNWVEKR